jgi:putative phosphoesterase
VVPSGSQGGAALENLQGEGLRLGIVSDTHGHVLFAREAVRMLESLGAQAVLHCGDIGSPEVVALFGAWPAHFVFGNVDLDAARLRQAIQECGHTCHERFGTLELAGCRLAFLHGDDERLLRETIAGGRYDLVCHGHTHVARQEQVGRTLVVNPGALYRATPHRIAIVDLPSLEVISIPL